MEEIYNPELFNSTTHVELKEYFKKYREELFPQQKWKENVKDNVVSFLNDADFNDDKLTELSVLCSPDQLNVEGEPKQISLDSMKGIKAASLAFQPGEINDESRMLHTVKQVEERKKNPDKDRQLLRELRDRALHIKDNKPEGSGPPDLIPGEEILIVLRLFRSFTYRYSQPCPDDAIRFDQEITLLGSNTLADFRDKIKCSADLTVLTEVSENPQDKYDLVSAKKFYPSGFIFIDGMFYNDFREKDAIDYSKVIRNWAAEKKIGEFKTADMDKIEINSLKPRFGYPYVYQHQGRCEHIFIFSHAKLLSNVDPLHRNCYPYHSDVGGGKVAFCYICGTSLPVWLVVDCDRLPHNNTPLCNECFCSYCYVDQKKVGNFKAYPFAGRTAMF